MSGDRTRKGKAGLVQAQDEFARRFRGEVEQPGGIGVDDDLRAGRFYRDFEAGNRLPVLIHNAAAEPDVFRRAPGASHGCKQDERCRENFHTGVS